MEGMHDRKSWEAAARRIVGAENVITDPSPLAAYSRDESALEELACVPFAVVRPGTTAEVSGIVKLSGTHRIPLTARGGGTGLSGACVAAEGGVVLSMERLNRCVDADPANSTITVEAGMPLRGLYEAADAMGMFFPPHPGDEGAHVGGLVAANAGGSRAVKYGTIKRFVLGLQVVLADGSIVELGGKTVKSSTGYHLLDLMIGSEGTLGIITRVTLSLVPKPGSLKTLVAPFESVRRAIQVVPALISSGVVPAAVEFIPHQWIRCSERLLKKRWPVRTGWASLMVILDGHDEEDVLSQAQQLMSVVGGEGALDVLLAETAAQQAEILELRSMIYEAIKPATVEVLDVCVPRSQIASHVEFVFTLEERLGVPIPTYGHAADGNVHSHTMKRLLVDGELGDEIHGWRALHEEAKAEIYRDAIRRGGLISGEHGIGVSKREFVEQNLGSSAVAMMRAIKDALDPMGILNPGKVIPVREK
jgi:glycolate dehydrogenase FAD-linked subunit